MTPERWQKMWDLFDSALEQPEPARARFLDGECGADRELRIEIDALLAADTDDRHSLDAPAALLDDDPAADSVSSDLEPGALIGPYQIVRAIGEGGMGTVYEAEQQRPVRRRVALKVIKLGMDTREVVARFDAERQALALMNHSNIARVLEAGATTDGRPYFVMELVDGVPITEFCDAGNLTLAARLELLIGVCAGVDHAHRKGVIHRDLKPNNILVTAENERPVAKIIDFGIAKAIEQPLTDHTLRTRLGLVIGTPDYMSPEQFRTGGIDVDTRTDVYALSALLYELLVGSTPFDVATLRSKGFAELERAISHTEAMRPSTRLARLSPEQSAAVTRRRSATPHALARSLKGDLDWIVLKGLSKERDARYASPGDLAADLRRHLDGDPVEARPPSLAYRGRKFVQRHRFGVALASVTAVAVVAVAVTMTVQTLRLQRALTAADEQRERAEQVARFMIDLFSRPDPQVANGETITVRQVLDAGADRISSELAEQPRIKADLMRTMGTAYRELGLHERSEHVLTEALALQRAAPDPDPTALVSTLHALAELRNEQGDQEAARKLYEEAVATGRARLEDGETLASSLTDYSIFLGDQGELDAAAPLANEALEMRRRIAGAESVEVAKSLANVARIAHLRGENATAEPLLRNALALTVQLRGERHPDVAIRLTELGILLNATGRSEEAAAAYRKALDIYRKTHGDRHSYVGTTLNNLATALSAQGRYVEARAAIEEALSIWRALFDPRHPQVASGTYTLATICFFEGDYATAEREMRTALELDREALGPDHPSIALDLDWVGQISRERGFLAAALEAHRASLELRRRVLGDANAMVARSLQHLALATALQGGVIAAEPMAREAVQRDLDSQGPRNPRTAASQHALGRVLLLKHDYAGAETALREALAIRREVRGAQHPEVADTLHWLALTLAEAGRAQQAETTLRESLAIRRATLPATHPHLGHTLAALGGLLCSEEQTAEGSKLLNAALPILRAGLPAGDRRTVAAETAAARCI